MGCGPSHFRFAFGKRHCVVSSRLIQSATVCGDALYWTSTELLRPDDQFVKLLVVSGYAICVDGHDEVKIVVRVGEAEAEAPSGFSQKQIGSAAEAQQEALIAFELELLPQHVALPCEALRERVREQSDERLSHRFDQAAFDEGREFVGEPVDARVNGWMVFDHIEVPVHQASHSSVLSARCSSRGLSSFVVRGGSGSGFEPE